MEAPTKNGIGYFIAGFGALLILLTMFLLYQGVLPVTESKGIIIALILAGALLVGLGMYAVVPKQSHDFVTDVGGVARDIVPRFARRSDTTVVQPAAGQTTVVEPPAGAPVAVSPEGNVSTIPPLPAPEPEVATGAALPLRQQADALVRGEYAKRGLVAPTRSVPITGAMRRRQDLYPHDEA